MTLAAAVAGVNLAQSAYELICSQDKHRMCRSAVIPIICPISICSPSPGFENSNKLFLEQHQQSLASQVEQKPRWKEWRLVIEIETVDLTGAHYIIRQTAGSLWPNNEERSHLTPWSSPASAPDRPPPPSPVCLMTRNIAVSLRHLTVGGAQVACSPPAAPLSFISFNVSAFVKWTEAELLCN